MTEKYDVELLVKDLRAGHFFGDEDRTESDVMLEAISSAADVLEWLEAKNKELERKLAHWQKTAEDLNESWKELETKGKEFELEIARRKCMQCMLLHAGTWQPCDKHKGE
jgi:predicted RNase H-like nuclease (RuvC/YqgF family)